MRPTPSIWCGHAGVLREARPGFEECLHVFVGCLAHEESYTSSDARLSRRNAAATRRANPVGGLGMYCNALDIIVKCIYNKGYRLNEYRRRSNRSLMSPASLEGLGPDVPSLHRGRGRALTLSKRTRLASSPASSTVGGLVISFSRHSRL